MYNILNNNMNLKLNNDYSESMDASIFIGADDETREKLNELRHNIRESSDTSIYNANGKKWYQSAFSECFVFMYDESFYNKIEKRYMIDELLDKGEREFGGYDIIVLWQSYPRLGIDQRNQFDYYRDMPGGLDALKGIVKRAHKRNVKVFINYNPWDEGTRREDASDAELLAQIIHVIDADGIFLDTMGGADSDFINIIEGVNPNIVLDPESIPETKDFTSITGGWLQVYDMGYKTVAPPYLPAIRWLEPRFSFRGIDRDLESKKEHIALSFFHGYGYVVWENVFGWWNPWSAEDRNFFKKCLSILRAYKEFFLDLNWQPYVSILQENVYAHKWTQGNSAAYTFFNMNEKQVEGQMIEIDNLGNRKCFDVWNGKEIETIEKQNKTVLSFSIEPNSVSFILIQEKDMPKTSIQEYPTSSDCYYRKRVNLTSQEPRSVNYCIPANSNSIIPNMVNIKGGRYLMNVHHNVFDNMEGACYGDVTGRHSKEHPTQYFWLNTFFMDVFEVTNEEYKLFLKATKYCPDDLTNFLKLWEKPQNTENSPWLWLIPEDKYKHPVVWVDLNDAREYAKWAGKRLPTEEEWQYASQGLQYNVWPWGEEYHEDYCNGASEDTTPVDLFSQGASPFGCKDMVGNVWEWTESERHDGHSRYAIIKGGSHYKITGSGWYVSSGAQSCEVHEKILLMYPGLDRCSTVGFRCVKDITK